MKIRFSGCAVRVGALPQKKIVKKKLTKNQRGAEMSAEFECGVREKQSGERRAKCGSRRLPRSSLMHNRTSHSNRALLPRPRSSLFALVLRWHYVF
jgi:hypothetical protein